MVDTLLGIMIISVALVGFALTFRQSTTTTVVDRNYNQATYYAQQALERLKVNDGQTSSSSITWAYTWSVAAAGALPAYTITTEQLSTANLPAEYTALSSDIQAKLIPVQVTVTWQEQGGGAGLITRTLKVVSYYYLQ